MKTRFGLSYLRKKGLPHAAVIALVVIQLAVSVILVSELRHLRHEPQNAAISLASVPLTAASALDNTASAPGNLANVPVSPASAAVTAAVTRAVTRAVSSDSMPVLNYKSTPRTAPPQTAPSQGVPPQERPPGLLPADAPPQIQRPDGPPGATSPEAPELSDGVFMSDLKTRSLAAGLSEEDQAKIRPGYAKLYYQAREERPNFSGAPDAEKMRSILENQVEREARFIASILGNDKSETWRKAREIEIQRMLKPMLNRQAPSNGANPHP